MLGLLSAFPVSADQHDDSRQFYLETAETRDICLNPVRFGSLARGDPFIDLAFYALDATPVSCPSTQIRRAMYAYGFIYEENAVCANVEMSFAEFEARWQDVVKTVPQLVEETPFWTVREDLQLKWYRLHGRHYMVLYGQIGRRGRLYISHSK